MRFKPRIVGILTCCSIVPVLIGCVATESDRSWPGASSNNDSGLLGSSGSGITSGRPERGVARSIVDVRSPAPRDYVDIAPDSLKRNAGGASSSDPVVDASGNFSLNFVDVELQEFVRAAFDEVLHENVVIDPTLTGRVTVRTAQPVSRPVAQQLVLQAIQAAGAMSTKSGSVWRIAPTSASGSRLRETVRVIPLEFIDATSASQALQPFGAGSGAEVSIGGNGRFLIVAGKAVEVEAVQQVVSSLDIDELRSRSFALIPLKQASAEAVTREIGQMIATSGASQTRILPLERMNAIMVVSPDTALIARIRKWVPRLDQNSPEQRKVFVYPVRNRRASEIAAVLEGMFHTQSKADAASAESTVAPGMATERIELPSMAAGAFQPPSRDMSSGSLGRSADLSSPFGALPGSHSQASSNIGGLEGIVVRADVATNTLVIVCKQNEYALVESAVRNLDVLPAQVLIEVTIAEVQLNQSLSHGVSWFFQAGHHSFGATNADTSSGFTYTFGVPNAQIALQALESVTKVEIMAAPALTVLDNQTATLKVGDEVPIQTQTAQSVTTADAPIISSITLKETGIILKVTPRVNASGLVLLDIDQEDSDVVPTTTSNINSPTIRQRQINSSVAVQSGGEIVLGGIITRQKEHDQSGLPFLNSVPLIGKALATSGLDSDSRTELLVILRPTVLANQGEVSAVTQEIKRRMHENTGR